MLIKILTIILTTYLIALIFLFIFQRNFLYFPKENNYLTSEKINDENLEVYITNNQGHKLKSWFYYNEKNKFTILFFHGNAGQLENRIYKLNVFRELGLNYLIFSYRGFNSCDGSPSEKGIYNDAQSAYQWLLSKGISKNKIVFYGESLGTGVGVNMSINNTSAGLILESPFTSITDLGKKKFPIFPISLILKDRFDNESKFERLSVPLLVMHGKKDKIVPQNMSFRLIKLKEPTVTYFPENDNYDIFIMNDDGTNKENLTNSLGYEKYPQFSPDGSFIIYQGWQKGKKEIFFIWQEKG